MSESSNSGVLSRALLLPLRRISLISSSREVGSFAMIPENKQNKWTTTKTSKTNKQTTPPKQYLQSSGRLQGTWIWRLCSVFYSTKDTGAMVGMWLTILSRVHEQKGGGGNSTVLSGGVCHAPVHNLPCSPMLATLFKLRGALTYKKGMEVGRRFTGKKEIHRIFVWNYQGIKPNRCVANAWIPILRHQRQSNLWVWGQAGLHRPCLQENNSWQECKRLAHGIRSWDPCPK